MLRNNNFKFYTIIFSLFFIVACNSAIQEEKNTTANEGINQKTAPILPKYKLLETAKYKSLKKEVEKSQVEVEELEAEKRRLSVRYTKHYSKMKSVSKKLEIAKEKLKKLESELNKEAEKLELKEKDLPV